MINRSKKAACILICLIQFAFTKAQINTHSKLNNVSVTVQQYYGSYLTTAPKATYIRDSYSSFTEISISKQTNGSKAWHRSNNYPEGGLGIVYGNPGSKKYLGKAISLYPYIGFAILRTRNFKSSFRIGTGISWVEKPYDVRTNHKNTLIGSHLNNYIHLSQENEIRLSRSLFFNAGLAFAHISNGSIKLPNHGLNFVTLTTGIRYSFNEKIIKDTTIRAVNKKKTIRLLLSTGVRQTPWTGSPRYVVGVLNTEVVKPISSANNIGAGLDIFYDPSITNDPSGYSKTRNKLENVQIGVHFLYERNIGRLAIPLQAGFYVLNSAKKGIAYQNFGIRYKYSSHLSFFYNLKVHTGKADFIHCGIGYSF